MWVLESYLLPPSVRFLVGGNVGVGTRLFPLGDSFGTTPLTQESVKGLWSPPPGAIPCSD